MTSALYFIVKSFAHLYVLLYLLRFWLPLVSADFRNPIAQAILRLTSPLIVPVRRFVPALGRIDTATVLVTLAIECVVVFVLFQIVSLPLDPVFLVLIAMAQLGMLSLHLFTVAIFVQVILSWVAPQTYNPMAAIASSLGAPLLKPWRRLLPTLGGIDFSPFVVIVLLQATVIYLQSLMPVRI